jgi:hypothetical protein
MTRQSHTKNSLLEALFAIVRRARTSLYQSFAGLQKAASWLLAVSTAVPTRRLAKVIPFPTPTVSHSPDTDHQNRLIVPSRWPLGPGKSHPMQKVPNQPAAFWPQDGPH